MSEGGGGNSGGTGDGGEKVTGKAGTHAAKPKVLHELLPKKIPHVLNENYVPSTPTPAESGDDQGCGSDFVIPDSQLCGGDTENAGKPNFDLRFQYEMSSQEILPTHVKEELNTDLDEFDFTQPSSPVFGTTYTQHLREKSERRVVVDKLLQEEIDAHIAKMHLQDSRNTPKEIKVRLSNREHIRDEIEKIVQSSKRKVRILEQVEGEFVTFRCVRDLRRANKRKKQAETPPQATPVKNAYQHMDTLVSRYRKDIYYHKAESSSKALQQMAVASVRGVDKVYEIYVPTLATLTFNNKEVYPVYGDQLHRRFQWPEFMSVTNVCKMLKRDTRKPVDLQVVKERFMIDEEPEGRKKYRHRISTFSVLTEAEAVKMAYDYKLILDEQDLPTPTGEEMTIGDLLQTYIHHYEQEVPFDRLTHGAGPALLSLTVYHLLEWISAQGNLILDPEAPPRETTGFQDWGDRLAGAIEVEVDKSSTEFARKRKSRKATNRDQGHGSDQADDKSCQGDEDDMRDFAPHRGGGQRRAAVNARSRLIQTFDMTQEDDEEEVSDEDDCRLIDDPNSSKEMDHEERQLSIIKLQKTANKIRNELSKSAKDIGKLEQHQTKINNAIQTITDVDKASKASSGGNQSKDSSFEEGVSDSQMLRAESEAIDKDREIEALKLEAELMKARLEQADPYAYALTRKTLMDLRSKDLLSAYLKFKNQGEEFRPHLENAESALDKVCQPVIGPDETMYQCSAGTVDKLKAFVGKGIISPNIVFNRKTFHKTGLDGIRKEKVIYVFQALEIKAEGADDRLQAEDVTLMDYETGDGTLPEDFEEKLKKIKEEEREGVDKDKDKRKDEEKNTGEVKPVDNKEDRKQKGDKSSQKPNTESPESKGKDPGEEKMEVGGEGPKFPQESSALAEAMDTAEDASRKQGRKHLSSARTRPSQLSRQHAVTAAEVNLCTDSVGTGTLCMKPPQVLPAAEFSDGDLKDAGINPAVTKKKNKLGASTTTRSTRSSVPK